jgi:uncharacterized protein
MESLIRKSLKKVQETDTSFKRYLYDKIDWSDRLIFIKGARGTGKTTLLLQHIKENFGTSEETLYVSLDDIWFSDNRLIDLVEQFVNLGGKFLYLDEVHKYPNWSGEIKNIYDDHPGLKIVITSSSALHIFKQQADLSRRAIVYDLHELSLREYIALRSGQSFPAFNIQQLLSDHVNLSFRIIEKIKPLRLFQEYCSLGCYPYFLENPANYHQRLLTTVNTILETDLPAILNIDYSSVLKLKKLLYIIATSVPFKPNITELSNKTGIARDTLLRYLHHLSEAHLILLLQSNKGGNSILTKPEKIYLHNSNLMAALADNDANIGTIRETFFLNQLSAAGKVYYTEQGDFVFIDTYVFEVGGKNKTGKQIKGLPDAFIVADDIESGYKNKIPIWLFGFLY